MLSLRALNIKWRVFVVTLFRAFYDLRYSFYIRVIIIMLSYLAIRNRLYKNISLILIIVRDIIKMLTRMIHHTDFINKNASSIVCFAKRIFIRLFFLLFCDNLFITLTVSWVDPGGPGLAPGLLGRPEISERRFDPSDSQGQPLNPWVILGLLSRPESHTSIPEPSGPPGPPEPSEPPGSKITFWDLCFHNSR